MYSISDLERISGIKAHTIRIWEKRYNFLTPERTEGNHRLYSDNDLIRLLNVQQLIARGLKISNVATWEKKKILDKVRDFTSEEKDESSEVEYYCSEWLASSLNYDEELFCAVYDELRSQMTFIDLWKRYMIPALYNMGQLWLTEDIVPAEEHFFSQLVRRKILSEMDGLPLPAFAEDPVVLFLPPNEYHELGLLVSEYILRSQKIPTVNLGADMPVDNIKKIVDKKGVRLLVSYVQGTAVDQDFIEYIKSLNKQELKVVLNGKIAEDDRTILKNQSHIYSYDTIDGFNNFIDQNLIIHP